MSYRFVVVDHDVFESLHQTALDITGLGGLHSSIDETFTISYMVEEGLMRCQAAKIRVLDESRTSLTEIVFREARKRAMTKTKRYTTTVDA